VLACSIDAVVKLKY